MKPKINSLNITEAQKEELRKSVAIRVGSKHVSYSKAEAEVINEWLEAQGLDTNDGGTILG